jgi:membrane fusion protein (multidrug efflux system)
VGDSNKVQRRILDIAGRSEENFIIRDGVKKGDQIVTAGIETLMEGAVVKPAAGKKDTVATTGK